MAKAIWQGATVDAFSTSYGPVKSSWVKLGNNTIPILIFWSLFIVISYMVSATNRTLIKSVPNGPVRAR